MFLVGCLVTRNDDVGAVPNFIDDALDMFGGLSVLKIDMKRCMFTFGFQLCAPW